MQRISRVDTIDNGAGASVDILRLTDGAAGVVGWVASCQRCGVENDDVDSRAGAAQWAHNHLCVAGDVVRYQTEIEADRRAEIERDR